VDGPKPHQRHHSDYPNASQVIILIFQIEPGEDLPQVRFMNSESGMEELRQRIRAALAADPSKSQRELANRLGISPAQVTSLLKAGGRRLQVAEVPIVEEYLGVRLFQSEAQVSDYQIPAHAAIAAHAAPRRASLNDLSEEGSPIAFDSVPADIAPAVQKLLGEHNAEIWRLVANPSRQGYLPGDYLVVDRGQSPRSGDIVLAEVRQSAGRWVPIFRRYIPPWLLSYERSEPPFELSDSRIAIIGPVVASFRTRQGR
jgi:DNA-binding CsgD family transcriptional regulator